MSKPDWLAIKPVNTDKYKEIKSTINSLGLHTVCLEAQCPNINECWGGGTATFMVLGDKCTRGCTFCAVPKSAKGIIIDELEPKKIAETIEKWKLGYVVITSVCRDDLPDQGATHFANCIKEIKKINPNTKVEVLIPDFSGNKNFLDIIIKSKPDVIGHNLETVERLSSQIRDKRASYNLSLNVLKYIKEVDASIFTKSAIMLGLGEKDNEIEKTMQDLRNINVDFFAVGQYLKPKGFHTEVKEYITPEKFKEIEKKGINYGFSYTAAGPFVRSSYRAGEYFIKKTIENKQNL
jgi:lipoic acid synthetase